MASTDNARHSRIDGYCWYRKSAGYGIPRQEWKWMSGTLRAWSTDYQEFESGPGMYPVGVVEDNKTGFCFSIHVEDICFSDVDPSK